MDRSPSTANAASECPMDRSPSATEVEYNEPNTVTTEPHVTTTKGNEPTPQLGLIKNYSLEQLQALATQHGIEITRPNAKGTPVRKTKQILYDELSSVSK